jgi:hypothetical protein
MEAAAITSCLEELNAELRAMSVKGEICLYGGAVMCLVYKARPSTKDVDAIFEPAAMIRQAARRVAERRDLRADWLNDAVKGFVTPHARQVLYEFDSLKVFVPDTQYLLAMKCLAARVDATDREDVRFLVGQLGLKAPDEVFRILEDYYPRGQIKPATRYFVEELFGQ